jgi:sialidase-1
MNNKIHLIPIMYWIKKIVYTTILTAIVFIASARAQKKAMVAQDSLIQYTTWKGFTRCDFYFKGMEARLIIPNKTLLGRPWVWRARFPDWHTDADSILISRGFYLTYVNTDDQIGSPAAVKIWDEFYEYLTQKYQLQKKVALMGVSRGGLYVYNWAKKNPEKVSCIYAEAPVCDFKSWPGGFGKSKGSPADWELVKKQYGFTSDEEARQYKNNPIDSLENLAAAKVPILHMIGLDDKIVPPDENTFPLVNKYIKLGGIATVVPCTNGAQKLEGHHFTIETPELVADFITYNRYKATSLNSTAFHQRYKNDLANAFSKFKSKGKGRVAFLGGSITYGHGWRDSVCAYLKKRFPETTFDFIQAGIPSMGSTPGAFRLEKDVLSRGEVDLLFEEAAVNDATNKYADEEQTRAMEGIIRHLRKSNPAINIVVMHFVDPDKMADYNNGIEPAVIVNHNKVAQHYQIPAINLAKEVTERINNGEFSWESDFKDLHPSPFGQGVYAKSIIQFLETANNISNEIIQYSIPEKLDKYCYDNGVLIDIAEAKKTTGWNIHPNWKPQDSSETREGFVNVPMLTSDKTGAVLKLNFSGTVAGMVVVAGPDAGMIEYRIDKQPWKKLNLFTSWSSSLHLPWYYTLAADLSAGKHMLEIKVVEEKDSRSNGNACRIRFFYTNK